MNRLLPYIAVLLSMLIWSAAGIAIKEALVVLPPMTMIVIRFTLAVLLMLVIGLCARRNKMLCLQKVDKKDVPLFVLGGIFQPFLYYILETFSYDALLSLQPLSCVSILRDTISWVFWFPRSVCSFWCLWVLPISVSATHGVLLALLLPSLLPYFIPLSSAVFLLNTIRSLPFSTCN